MFFKLVFLPIAIVSATEITTDTLGRFPVRFAVNNAPLDGFGELKLTESHFSFSYGGFMERDEVRPLLQPATGVSITRTLNLSFEHHVRSLATVRVLPRTALPHTNHRLEIGASPRSTFSRSVSSFLLTPTSTTESMIVINPTHPEQYAFENELFYAQQANNPDWSIVFGHHDLWGVNTAIRFSNESNTAHVDPSIPFIPCLIGSLEWSDGSPDNFMVPSRVIRDFVGIVRQRGIQVTRLRDPPHTLFLNNVNDEMIASLPTLQYIIETENRRHVNVVNLEPHEYIAPTTDVNVRQVLFSQSTIPNYCCFNKPLRHRMTLHFDTQNQRIGFGEPLVEL